MGLNLAKLRNTGPANKAKTTVKLKLEAFLQSKENLKLLTTLIQQPKHTNGAGAGKTQVDGKQTASRST